MEPEQHEAKKLDGGSATSGHGAVEGAKETIGKLGVSVL